jgi:hypothetical protein
VLYRPGMDCRRFLRASLAVGSLKDVKRRAALRFLPVAVPLIALVAAPTAACAQGWYLMVPPLEATSGTHLMFYEEARTKILKSWPLSTWTLSRSFNRAEDCEEEISDRMRRNSRNQVDIMQEYRRAKDDAERARLTLEQESLLPYVTRDRVAVCIASDDRRLK